MLFYLPAAFSQNQETGKIMDSVPVGYGNESFVVYLPKDYQEDKPASIVFIFEPLGRGKVGIDPFITASETFNHILICSNDAKNGPFELNFEIANRLFEKVFSTFNVDPNQIYLAGFSGGARLASSIAVLTKQIQGVIACGAGFSPNSYHQPSYGDQFSYVGLVGRRDMNYQEMLQTKQWLDIFGIDNTLFVNNDRHRWPPQEQIGKAFTWLELQAYKKNLKAKDFEFLKQTYHDFFTRAAQMEQASKYIEAVFAYNRLVVDFNSYYNTDSIQSRLRRLKQNPTYTKALLANEKLALEEGELKNMFDAKFASEINKESAMPSVKWWTKRLDKLNVKYIQSENRFEKSLGERMSYSIYALGIETGQIHLRNKNYKKALYCHKILELLLPKNPVPNIFIAKDYAYMMEEQQAITHLEIALEKGADKQILDASEFDQFRQTTRFKKLLSDQ